jgi:hypothetical protein
MNNLTIAEIKALPKEFDFKSNINPGLIYHAVKENHCYLVTADDCKWAFDEEDIHKHLLNDDFVICKENTTSQRQFRTSFSILRNGTVRCWCGNIRNFAEDMSEFIAPIIEDSIVAEFNCRQINIYKDDNVDTILNRLTREMRV